MVGDEEFEGIGDVIFSAFDVVSRRGLWLVREDGLLTSVLSALSSATNHSIVSSFCMLALLWSASLPFWGGH